MMKIEVGEDMTEEHTPEYIENVLRNEFKNDNLYRRIIKTPLEDYLFHDKILTLVIHPDHLYGTEEVAKMILEKKDGEVKVGIPSGSLRHYLTNLESYVSPAATGGRNKRLNYESVFRLQMIYLLKDQYGVNGLQQLVGILGSAIEVNQEASIASSDQSIRKLLEMFTSTGILVPDDDGIKVNPQLSSLISRVQAIEESQKHLLEGPTELIEEHKKLHEKIEELQTELNEQKSFSKQQERKLKFDITAMKMKVENQLFKDALIEWGKLPDSERLKRTGIFSKNEDTTKKDMFIRNYISEHLEDALKKEMRIDGEEEG